MRDMLNVKCHREWTEQCGTERRGVVCWPKTLKATGSELCEFLIVEYDAIFRPPFADVSECAAPPTLL